MNVAIIFLDYSRHEHRERTLGSIAKAGYPFDLFNINRKGLAAALNEGLDKTMNYDAIVTCANDILMPQNWLAEMVDYVRSIPETGMCGIHCVEGEGEETYINGKRVMRVPTSFGNVMIPRKAIDTIGYFNTAHDPYGMQDSDYAYRLRQTGFINYYIAGLKSDHIGHDVGSGTEYRQMKDEGLSKVDQIWSEQTGKYLETGNYTIFQKEWP